LSDCNVSFDRSVMFPDRWVSLTCVAVAVSPAIWSKSSAPSRNRSSPSERSTHASTLQLLTRHGCQVRAPAGPGCCGALPLHHGELERGLELARGIIAAFDSPEPDAVFTNAAGCGAAMREYGEHFKDDPALRPAAERVASKVRDVAEFVHGLPGLPPDKSLNVKVAYHDACHLLNGQGVQAEPRQLIRDIPGVDWTELHEAEVCCGSAGSYNLTEPELAGRLAARKAKNVIATGADVLVTGNPGCILQIRAALREQGSPIRVVHTVDFLAEAYTDGATNRGGVGSPGKGGIP